MYKKILLTVVMGICIKSILENMTGTVYTNLNKVQARTVINKFFNNNNNKTNFIRNNKERLNALLSYLLYKKYISQQDIVAINKNT